MNEQLPVVTASSSVKLIDLLASAVDKGADVATLERLSKLYEQAEASERKKAYMSAMAKAKAELQPIIKDGEITLGGGKSIKFETLAAIADAVNPILSKYDLFYTFPDSVGVEPHIANRIYVTCRLSHRDGYSEEATLDAPPDVGQNRNAVQAMGSTITYLQRYTLKKVLGLSVVQDRDGRPRAANRAPPPDIQQPKNEMPDAVKAGAIIKPDSPVAIPRGDGQWQDWTRSWLMMINGAPDAATCELWLAANGDTLNKLEDELLQHYQFVMREYNKRLRKLLPSEQP